MAFDAQNQTTRKTCEIVSVKRLEGTAKKLLYKQFFCEMDKVSSRISAKKQHKKHVKF